MSTRSSLPALLATARRRAVLVATALLCAAVVAPAPSEAEPVRTFLFPGDIVVLQVGNGTASLTGAAAPLTLREYSPSGGFVGTLAVDGVTLTGTNTVEGLLTANSGQYNYPAWGSIALAGYAAPEGTPAPDASPAGRVLMNVSQGGYGSLTTDHLPAGAITSTTFAGTDAYIAGPTVYYEGETWDYSDEFPVPVSILNKINGTETGFRRVRVVANQLYASADPTAAGAAIGTLGGSYAPQNGPQAFTSLPFAAGTAPTDPYDFQLVTLGSGSAPDTLYVADHSAGKVEKFSLISGTWQPRGAVAVPGAHSLDVVDTAGTVAIVASGTSGSDGTAYTFSDATGPAGRLSGTASSFATAPARTAFRGVTFTGDTTRGSGPGTRAVTTTAVTASAEPSDPGSDVTYTATVTSAASPAGTVLFTDGGAPIDGCTDQPITDGTATCTVTYADEGDHTITAEYSGAAGLFASTSDDYAHSVEIAPLAVTFAPKTPISYGTALGSDQLSGTANRPGTFTYSVLAGPSGSQGTALTEGSVLHAGSYTIQADFLPDDTTLPLTTATASLIVRKHTLHITALNAQRRYGAPDPQIVLSYKGFVNGDDETALAKPAATSIALRKAPHQASAPTSPAGAYKITVSGAKSDDYVLSYSAGTLTVTRPRLTVRVHNAVRAEGAADPAFSVSYFGFANGENESVLTGSLAFSTTADSASPAGKYDLTASGLKSRNYAIVYEAGTLRVTAV